MWLHALQVHGLRAAPQVSRIDLDRHAVQAPGPDSGAVADGIVLAAAFLDRRRLLVGLDALDLLTDDTDGLSEGVLLDEVEGLDPHGVAALVDDATPRHVQVELSLSTDPLLFRGLRDLAQRDPRMLAALASGADVRLRVGWLFNQAGTHASTSALALHVGDERFTTQGPEAPVWLPALLGRIGAAIGWVDVDASEGDLAHTLHEALLSPDPARRRGAHRLSQVLAEPPFELGALHLVRYDEDRLRLAVGDALTPLRAFGQRARAAVALAMAAQVDQPDVLVVDDPGEPAWLDWLVSRTEGADATLEQLVVVRRW